MKKKVISLMISAPILLFPMNVDVNAEQTEAEQYLSSMTTEDKISQMIMPVFRSTEDEDGNRTNVTEITENIENSLKKHSYSGVIVMGQNLPTNEGAVRFIDALQKANADGGSRPQLIISIDQEGGNVTRLGQGCVMTSNMSLGAANDIELTKEDASIIAGELRSIGINADFAPVVDINSNPSNPIIGIRSFSDDPRIVAKHGAAFVEALNENGVISTLKHFPGHGDTDTALYARGFGLTYEEQSQQSEPEESSQTSMPDESSAETSTESSAENDVSDVSNSTSDNVSVDNSAQSVPNTDNTPKTGDNNNSVILTAIPALCLSLFAVIYSWKRKKDTDEI